jgi:hypothetical protein
MENNKEKKLQADNEDSSDSGLKESIVESNAHVELTEEDQNITGDTIKNEIEKIQPVSIENVVYDINLDEIELVKIEETGLVSEEVHEIHDININDVPVNEPDKPFEALSTDYSSLGKRELIEILKRLIDNDDIQAIKNDVEEIKTQFYRIHKAELTAQKRAYFDMHGNLDNFEPTEDKEEDEFKIVYKKFKELKTESNDLVEREKERNLKAKEKIIEDIKNLVHKHEPINKIFAEFRELQQKWGEIGLVPQNSMKDLWHNYNLQIEKFYEFVKIGYELRDLDLKKNLEIKSSLCEKAEELLLEPILKKAVNELQKLHTKWTETGPVPREKREEIWERFKQTSVKINKRYQDYVDKLKLELETNFDAKSHITDKAEELAESMITGRNEWEQKTKEIIELQKMWKTIGAVPKKDSTAVFERFRNACDKFFNNKKEYFYSLHEDEINNLQTKTDLCVQAETIKNSTDWKKTTSDFINLQNKWKQIGPVPHGKSEETWKRFREACNYFFESKANYFSTFDTMLEENLKLKLDIIEKVEKFEHLENIDENLQKLKQFQKEWTEIGHVPGKEKAELQNKFRAAINKQFDLLKVDDTKRDILKYKMKIENMAQQPNSFEKVKQEKDFLRDRIKVLEADITLIDNNMGFFAKSKNSESLLSELNKKIENGKKELKLLKDKLKMLDKFK